MIKTADLTPRQKKTAISLVAVILIYILFGFAGAPFIVRNILENKVAGAIDRQVTVAAVRVNPITLSVTLRGLEIREQDGAPFVNLGEAYINLQTSSLFKWALVLKTMRLDNPVVDIVRLDEVRFNFSDIGKTDPAETQPVDDTAGSSGLAVAIYDVRIAGGRISLADRVTAVDHRIDDLAVHLVDFSSRPADVDVYTLFDLSARVNDAAVSLTGKTRPFRADRQTHAELGLDALDLPHYLPYLPVPPQIDIKTLTVNLDSEADFKMDADGKPELVAAGTLALEGLQLAHGDGTPLFSQKTLTVDLLPSALLAGQVRLAQVTVDGPEVFLERLPSGAIRLPLPDTDTAAAESPVPANPSEDSATTPVVTLDQLALNHGVVHFTDRANTAPFTTTITELNLTVDNAGFNSDRTAAYRLGLKTEADESISLTGTASLSPLQASGEIVVSDIRLPRYRPYYQDRFDFKTVAGTASLGGNYRFRQNGDQPLISLAGLHLNVAELEVTEAADDDPLVSLKRLDVTETTADLTRREITLGRLALSGAKLVCRREKNGTLNLVDAFVPDDAAAAQGVPGPPVVSSAAGPEAPAAEAEPFVLNLNTVEVAGLAVDVEDRVPAEPVKFRMDQIALSATDLSTASGKAGRADLSLRWEQKGHLRIGGKVAIQPLDLDLAVDLQKMDIRPFQPYLSEQVALIVTKGLAGTKGALRFSLDGDGLPVVNYLGDVGLNQFASIDRKNANDFLKWEGLRFENLAVGVNPARLSIDEIALSDFFARVIVDGDGSVNLVSMFNPPADNAPVNGEKADASAQKTQAADGSSESSRAPSVKIARVTMNRGIVDYSDRLIKPNFSARFHDLGGRISGLESMAEKRADVLLEGMWANHAPVKISGQVNPLIENPYVDLNLNISDIELSPFSPYSGKYIGYILEKGKLTFNVAYLMQDRRLEGKNSIFIDQLTLGDTVDSPDAVNLPIKLAIALLKDRNGNIELDLPVSGNLDDPQFKIGKVVLTVLKNLIVKIVTSPFAALGALVDGGEELGYLEFAAGVSDISAENAAKIDKLAEILYARPGLKLDIQGTAGPQWDSDALRATLLENRLKSVKLERMLAAGNSAVPLEEISLDAVERAEIIVAVFAESGIAMPLDDSGKPVEATPEEMEKLLRTSIEVTPNDYRQLASARAFNVKQYLLENGQVAKERIFIVEPEIGPEGPQGTAPARLVFSLK